MAPELINSTISSVCGIVGGTLGVASFVIQLFEKRQRFRVFVHPVSFDGKSVTYCLAVANVGLVPFTVCGAGVAINGRKHCFGVRFDEVPIEVGAVANRPHVVQQGAMAMFAIPLATIDEHFASGGDAIQRFWEFYVQTPSGEKWQGVHKGCLSEYCRAAAGSEPAKPHDRLAGIREFFKRRFARKDKAR